MENNKYKDIKFDFTELKEVIDKLLSDAEKRIKEKNKEQKPKSELDILRERIDMLEKKISDLENNSYIIPYQRYYNSEPLTIPPHPVTFKDNTETEPTITSTPKTENGWTIPHNAFSFGSTDTNITANTSKPGFGCKTTNSRTT